MPTDKERVLKYVQEVGEAFISDIAQNVGISLSSARKIVDELVKEGKVERVKFKKLVKVIPVKPTDDGEWISIDEDEMDEEDGVQEEQREERRETQKRSEQKQEEQKERRTIEDEDGIIIKGEFFNVLNNASAITGIDVRTILFEAVRDWLISHGIKVGDINTVYGVPMVSMSKVKVIDEKVDPITKKVKKLYMIPNYKEVFEDNDLVFYPDGHGYNDLKRACYIAKMHMDRGLKAVIVHDEEKEVYKIFVEVYDLLKEIRI